MPTTLPRVSARAKERLARIAAATGGARHLRVEVSGGGCSGFRYDIRLDKAAADDVLIEEGGTRVLVDPVSLPFLDNAVIDFVEEAAGAHFVVRNPNVSSSCGCGTSFAVRPGGAADIHLP